MPNISKSLFELRGGSGCSNSHYSLSSASCCAGIGLEDEELHHFYFNATDLSLKINLWENFACPFCGDRSFDLKSVPLGDPIPLGWSWAIDR